MLNRSPKIWFAQKSCSQSQSATYSFLDIFLLRFELYIQASNFTKWSTSNYFVTNLDQKLPKFNQINSCQLLHLVHYSLTLVSFASCTSIMHANKDIISRGMQTCPLFLGLSCISKGFFSCVVDPSIAEFIFKGFKISRRIQWWSLCLSLTMRYEGCLHHLHCKPIFCTSSIFELNESGLTI